MQPNAPGTTSSLQARLTASATFVSVILLANLAITQWVASRMAYHPALGSRWFGGLYQPFAWIGWQKWYESAPTTFNIAYLVVLVTVLFSLAGTVLYVGFKTRSARAHESMHGTAHWATEEEVRKTGLLATDTTRAREGVYVGGWTNPKTGDIHYLRHDGPEHVCALAPTRSGKGVGLVVPTCLSWPHSIVVNDRKAELWNLTAGWRATGANNIVMKFNPSSPSFDDCVAFNPLDEIRLGTESEVADAQNIAQIIVDPDGKGLNDHWQKTAFALMTGALLHECYKARQANVALANMPGYVHRTATLYDVLFALTDPSRDIVNYYEEMIANKHDTANIYNNNGSHPAVAAEGRGMLNKPEDERGSVLSTVTSYLSLYRDPIVRHHTRRSDFSIMDLMNAERPVSLYIVGRDEDKDRMRPLMRLILNQIVRVLLRPEIAFENGRQLPPHKHRLLLMLDEFPSFGKLEIFQEALAFIAGYGIKAYLIMQDISQLWSQYGRDETVTANCHVRVGYAPNKPETAEWLSKMTGTKTELKVQITESGKRFGAVADGFSKTSQETSRPLMTVDEAMRLRAPVKNAKGDIVEAGDMLVFVAGHAPIMGTQSLFFVDPVFLERSRVPRIRPAPPLAAKAVVPGEFYTDPALQAVQEALWGTEP